MQECIFGRSIIRTISFTLILYVQVNNFSVLFGESSYKPSICTQFVMTMSCTMSKVKGPVCRRKLVLLYLCSLLLANSYAPEPNPGPRTPKYPCGHCQKAVKWTTPGVMCDTCKVWYHSDCMGMSDTFLKRSMETPQTTPKHPKPPTNHI